MDSIKSGVSENHQNCENSILMIWKRSVVNHTYEFNLSKGSKQIMYRN